MSIICCNGSFYQALAYGLFLLSVGTEQWIKNLSIVVDKVLVWSYKRLGFDPPLTHRSEMIDLHRTASRHWFSHNAVDLND